MSQRVTNEDLKNRQLVVNRMLKGLRVETQGRNGYTGLDLFDSNGMVRTLTTGSKREVFEYLGAMIDTLHMVGRD